MTRDEFVEAVFNELFNSYYKTLTGLAELKEFEGNDYEFLEYMCHYVNSLTSDVKLFATKHFTKLMNEFQKEIN